MLPDCEEDHYTSGHFTKLLQISSFFACHGLKMSLFFRKSYRSSTFPPRFLPFPFRPFTYYVRTFIGFWLPPPSLPPYLHHFKHWKKAFFFFFSTPFPPTSAYVIYEWSLCIAWFKSYIDKKEGTSSFWSH